MRKALSLNNLNFPNLSGGICTLSEEIHQAFADTMKTTTSKRETIHEFMLKQDQDTSGECAELLPPCVTEKDPQLTDNICLPKTLVKQNEMMPAQVVLETPVTSGQSQGSPSVTVQDYKSFDDIFTSKPPAENTPNSKPSVNR